MKKTIAWILGLIMLLGLGMAAGESALPEIPAFEGTLNVRPVTTAEEAVAYAREFWALDYLGMDMTDAAYECVDQGDDLWHVQARVGEELLELTFDRDGNVLRAENIGSGWTDIAPALEAGEQPVPETSEEEELAAVNWRETLDRMVEYPFLSEVNPAVYEQYTTQYPINEGSNEYLAHYSGTYNAGDGKEFDLNYSEVYGEGSFRIKIGVQTRPVLRIVFFDAQCEAEEGGNG